MNFNIVAKSYSLPYENVAVASKRSNAVYSSVNKSPGRVLHREPDLLVPSEVVFHAHALAVLTSDHGGCQCFDGNVEDWNIQLAHDESTAKHAMAEGLETCPCYVLLEHKSRAKN